MRGPDASVVIVASKQIYANHCFDASLGLGAFLQFKSSPQQTYLMYLNRSRTGLLVGWLGFVKRPLVKKQNSKWSSPKSPTGKEEA
jgi:hypothetical protein